MQVGDWCRTLHMHSSAESPQSTRVKAHKINQRWKWVSMFFNSTGWRQWLSFHRSEDPVRRATWQRRKQLTFGSWADSAELKCQFVCVSIRPASDKLLEAWWRNWADRSCCCCRKENLSREKKKHSEAELFCVSVMCFTSFKCCHQIRRPQNCGYAAWTIK